MQNLCLTNSMLVQISSVEFWFLSCRPNIYSNNHLFFSIYIFNFKRFVVCKNCVPNGNLLLRFAKVFTVKTHKNLRRLYGFKLSFRTYERANMSMSKTRNTIRDLCGSRNILQIFLHSIAKQPLPSYLKRFNDKKKPKNNKSKNGQRTIEKDQGKEATPEPRSEANSKKSFQRF